MQYTRSMEKVHFKHIWTFVKCSTLEAWKKYTLSTFGLRKFSDARSTKKVYFFSTSFMLLRSILFSTSEKYTLSILLEDFTNFNN